MKWEISYSHDARKFLDRESSHRQIKNELINFLKKIEGENINIDVKKLKGSWKGFYRIRKGKIRIIFSVEYDNKVLFVNKIDFRGDVYK